MGPEQKKPKSKPRKPIDRKPVAIGIQLPGKPPTKEARAENINAHVEARMASRAVANKYKRKPLPEPKKPAKPEEGEAEPKPK